MKWGPKHLKSWHFSFFFHIKGSNQVEFLTTTCDDLFSCLSLKKIDFDPPFSKVGLQYHHLIFHTSFYITGYGITCCGIFKAGIQNWKGFSIKINCSLMKLLNFENWTNLSSLQKSEFLKLIILIFHVKNWITSVN